MPLRATVVGVAVSVAVFTGAAGDIEPVAAERAGERLVEQGPDKRTSDPEGWQCQRTR
jgi:hypothetical protein